jgi:uncharacterized lipoprotein
MKFVRFGLLVLAVGLTGCSNFTSSYFVRNHDKTYLQARSIRPIQVPPGLSSKAINTTYPIPERSYPPGSADVSLVPPGLAN